MLPRKVDSSGLDSRDWLADTAEVAIILGTDLHIKHTLDNAFYKLTHCKIAGAFRGLGDFLLNQPRSAISIKTKILKESGRRGGGINPAWRYQTCREEAFQHMKNEEDHIGQRST